MFSTTDKGLNYIIFYNKYSGLLKGFYYLEGSTTLIIQQSGISLLNLINPF